MRKFLVYFTVAIVAGLIGFAILGRPAPAQEACPPGSFAQALVEDFLAQPGSVLVRKVEGEEFKKVFAEMVRTLGPFIGDNEPTSLWVIDKPPIDGTVGVAYRFGNCFYRAFPIQQEKLDAIIDKALKGNRI